MDVQYFGSFRQVEVGVDESAGSRKELCPVFAPELYAVLVEDPVQFLCRQAVVEEARRVVLKEHDPVGCGSIGLQPSCVAERVKILRERGLHGPDIEDGANAFTIQPVNSAVQVRENTRLAGKCPGLIRNRHRFENKDMRLVDHIAHILRPVLSAPADLLMDLMRVCAVEDPAQDRDAGHRFLIAEALRFSAQLCGICIFDPGQKVEKVRFIAPSQDQPLLFPLVFEHGLDGEPYDHGDFADAVGLAGNAQDAFCLAVRLDRHVDAGERAGIHLVVFDLNDVRAAPKDPPGGLVIGADPAGIAARDDHAVAVHDVDVVFCVAGDLVDQLLCHVGFDHSCISVCVGCAGVRPQH